MSLTAQAEKQKKRTTAQLVAEVAVGDLSGRMLALAEAVTSEPHNFTSEHAAKLRNAAQVAVSAAELIALEQENERTRTS